MISMLFLIYSFSFYLLSHCFSRVAVLYLSNLRAFKLRPPDFVQVPIVNDEKAGPVYPAQPYGITGAVSHVIMNGSQHAISKTYPCNIQIFFFSCKNLKFHQKIFDINLIFAQNIDCGYTLEPPRRGGSNEYPQSMFWSKNKENRFAPAYPRFTIRKWV